MVLAVATLRFVDDWFGSNATSVLGVNASTIVPPNAAARAAVLSGSATPTEVARVGVWELWRSRAYAEAVEQFRTALHPLGVSVLANTVFWVPYAATQWQYGLFTCHLSFFLSFFLLCWYSLAYFCMFHCPPTTRDWVNHANTTCLGECVSLKPPSRC